MLADAAKERAAVCRQEVLTFLAERQRLAHTSGAIRRGVNRQGHDFSQEEIESAASFHVSAENAKEGYLQFGGVKTYQATSNGVLANERGE